MQEHGRQRPVRDRAAKSATHLQRYRNLPGILELRLQQILSSRGRGPQPRRLGPDAEQLLRNELVQFPKGSDAPGSATVGGASIVLCIRHRDSQDMIARFLQFELQDTLHTCTGFQVRFRCFCAVLPRESQHRACRIGWCLHAGFHTHRQRGLSFFMLVQLAICAQCACKRLPDMDVPKRLWQMEHRA